MVTNKVLWITLDATPLSLWGCYGNLQGWTPFLDALAANGVLFDEYYFTGLRGEESAKRPRWAECMRRCGGVADFISAESANKVSRTDRTFWGDLERRLGDAIRSTGESDRPGLIACQLPELSGECSEVDDEDSEPESPPPRGFPYELLSEDERTGVIQDLVFLDEWLGKIHGSWDEATDEGTNSWFIVTAARGQSFPFVEDTEHPGPPELARHVPLLICNGSGKPAGERVRGLTCGLELESAMMGLHAGEEAGADEWRKFLRGEIPAEKKSLVWRDPHGDPVLRTPEGMLVEGESRQVFHLPEDRWGLQDVSHSEEELTERLQGELRKKLAGEETGT
ncbi:MAG: hypothetical protein U0903_07565 [Planctomycetales bacterium]